MTAGGVDTAGLNARTLEARSVPGLFFIGEAVDVTGWLGGFNFQWAWASGVAAGRVVWKQEQGNGMLSNECGGLMGSRLLKIKTKDEKKKAFAGKFQQNWVS